MESNSFSINWQLFLYMYFNKIILKLQYEIEQYSNLQFY